MIILPAIDIIDGKPVRLVQGDYSSSHQVAAGVKEAAENFEKQGAEFVHMVDLDGAKAGHPVNIELILETANALNIPVEVGGGIRRMEDIEAYLNGGVERVILGTSALENPGLLKEAAARFGKRIAVGVDCKDGKVCTSGWLDVSDKDYLEFAKELEAMGVATIIFTDISRDGTLAGPNVDMLKKLADACSLQIIASGGIKDISHIGACADLNLYGAITGKAMYSGTLDLKEAIARGKQPC